MVIDLDIDEKNNKLTFLVESRELLEDEISCLHIYRNLPEGKDFQNIYEYQASSTQEKIIIIIPNDAKIEEIERYDSDSPYGALVEVIFPRKKKLNTKMLKGHRYAHLKTTVKTTVPLVVRELDDENSQ